jgi:hypothetical protein
MLLVRFSGTGGKEMTAKSATRARLESEVHCDSPTPCGNMPRYVIIEDWRDVLLCEQCYQEDSSLRKYKKIVLRYGDEIEEGYGNNSK